jgi:hypothetical protein
MRSNWFKYLVTISLLMIYINRGLFVAVPEYSSSSEINSLLEVIINLTGGHNDIDEDGDSSETYDVAQTVQPLINPNFTTICLDNLCVPAHKLFFIFDETIFSFDTYKSIDKPPEMS